MSQLPLPPLTFEDTDAFGWTAFAEKLEAFLCSEIEFVEGSLVASLNAPFGSGKTTFLRMWKHRLDARQASDEYAPLAISLNAWEDDYCGDPLLSLIDAIEKELGGESPGQGTRDRLEQVREATRDIAWFGLGLANGAVAHWTGVNTVAAGELAEAKRAEREGALRGPDILSLFQARKRALQKLKTALRALFGRESRPVFVLVDELDRCRPDFAVHYLETIKHIFDVEGLAFVLAVDQAQLENSAKALFGNGLDFPEYYRKFAHRNIRLPKPDEGGVRKLLAQYIAKYLHDPSDTPRRKSLLNPDQTNRALEQFAQGFGLTPRQIQEAFRILGHLTSVRGKKSGDLFWHVANATIFLVFLSFHRPEKFKEIRGERISMDGLLELIAQMPLTENGEWWAFVLTISFPSNSAKLDDQERLDLFIKHGFVDKETNLEVFRRDLRNYSPRGGTWSSLAKLARKIEEIEAFGG
jgi:hypothetical protein